MSAEFSIAPQYFLDPKLPSGIFEHFEELFWARIEARRKK